MSELNDAPECRWQMFHLWPGNGLRRQTVCLRREPGGRRNSFYVRFSVEFLPLPSHKRTICVMHLVNNEVGRELFWLRGDRFFGSCPERKSFYAGSFFMLEVLKNFTYKMFTYRYLRRFYRSLKGRYALSCRTCDLKWDYNIFIHPHDVPGVKRDLTWKYHIPASIA